MQLANVMSPKTLKQGSLPYSLHSQAELCVYPACQEMPTFCGSPPPHPCSLPHLSHGSFKAPVFTNLGTGRKKTHPNSVSPHPLSKDDLSQCSTSLEMALFLFKFSLKSFHTLFHVVCSQCCFLTQSPTTVFITEILFHQAHHGLPGICSPKSAYRLQVHILSQQMGQMC